MNKIKKYETINVLMKDRHDYLPRNSRLVERLCASVPTCVILLISQIGLYEVSTAAPKSTSDGLPAHWRAGGNAKIKMMPRRTMDERKESEDDERSQTQAGEQRFQPFSLSLALSTPELLRFDAKYQPSRYFSFRLSAGPGWPFKITVEMPSDVIQSDKSNTLAAAYPAFNADFEAIWGPHILLTGNYYPLGSSWFLSFGGGFRQLSIKGSAESALRVCTITEAAKEPPCGDNKSALETRNKLRIDANAILTSTLLQAGTGWQWQPGDRWEILLALGAVRPIKTTANVTANAEIIDPDGTPQEVSGSLAELKAKSENDLSTKAETELSNFATMTLPVVTFGIGYRL